MAPLVLGYSSANDGGVLEDLAIQRSPVKAEQVDEDETAIQRPPDIAFVEVDPVPPSNARPVLGVDGESLTPHRREVGVPVAIPPPSSYPRGHSGAHRSQELHRGERPSALQREREVNARQVWVAWAAPA